MKVANQGDEVPGAVATGCNLHMIEDRDQETRSLSLPVLTPLRGKLTSRRPHTAMYNDGPARRVSVSVFAKPTSSMKRSASTALSTRRSSARRHMRSRWSSICSGRGGGVMGSRIARVGTGSDSDWVSVPRAVATGSVKVRQFIALRIQHVLNRLRYTSLIPQIPQTPSFSPWRRIFKPTSILTHLSRSVGL